MDNKRVGFAESVYSDLSEHQSAAHTNQILLNMSSYQELEYFMEAAGLDHGVEALVATLVVISVICGAILAKCLVGNGGDSETKQARKALANVLNTKDGIKDGKAMDGPDDMFDVPLNDDRSYVGPDMTTEGDMLTSEASYAKVPSKPQNPSSRKAMRVGNLIEDQHSFDTEL